MKSAPLATHAVPATTRDGWRGLEHRVLKRRGMGSRAVRRRPAVREASVRDAIETWLPGARTAALLFKLAVVLVVSVAAADLLDDAPPLHLVSLIGAVLLAGAATLLAVTAAETDGIYPAHARR